MFKRLLFSLGLGLAAHIVAANVLALFVPHPTTTSALTLAPLIEEACAVIALANLRAGLKTPLTPSSVLAFGVVFSVLEFATNVHHTQNVTPAFSTAVVWLGPFATMLFHIVNASVAARFIIRRQSLPAFLACASLHAIYNAYVLFGFATLPQSAETIEVVLRSAVIGVGIYLVLASATFDHERKRALDAALNSPT